MFQPDLRADFTAKDPRFPWEGVAALTVVACLIVMAWWENATAQPQQSPDRVFMLTVTAEDVRIIGSALNDRPFREVAPLINKLQQQIAAQEKPPAPPSPSPGFTPPSPPAKK